MKQLQKRAPFITVVEACSIVAAGETTDLSKAAVSLHVGDLVDEGQLDRADHQFA